ncbi:MAG: hypothetical protein EBR18_09545, partial [Betaproteobacteria bacterium]|nr:hypothetical protein [Betaproteobacteria bacterium]
FAVQAQVSPDTLIVDEALAVGDVKFQAKCFAKLQELKSKGLEPQAVADAVAHLRSTELIRAREVWRKKYGQAAPNAAERAKQYRFLATRGFSGEVIAKLLGDPHGEWGQE